MADLAAGGLIEYVCDAHLPPNARGPLVTRHEGRWAYCAGYGDGGHVWRRVAPIGRDVLARAPARVGLICDRPDHLDHGREVPDGHGNLTISGRTWAYCSAARDEPHTWRPVSPLELTAIEHDRLAAMLER